MVLSKWKGQMCATSYHLHTLLPAGSWPNFVHGDTNSGCKVHCKEQLQCIHCWGNELQ